MRTMHVPLLPGPRLLLLLLLVAAWSSSAAPAVPGVPVPAVPEPGAAPLAPTVPPARTMARSDGKLVMRKLKHRHEGDAAETNIKENIIKAPRRSFGPERVLPNCPTGFDVDHKGKCRENWS